MGFGLICSFMALIFKIFWHDCVRHLNRQMVLESMMKNKGENKTKLRIIQVKPMERIGEETSV